MAAHSSAEYDDETRSTFERCHECKGIFDHGNLWCMEVKHEMIKVCPNCWKTQKMPDMLTVRQYRKHQQTVQSVQRLQTELNRTQQLLEPGIRQIQKSLEFFDKTCIHTNQLAQDAKEMILEPRSLPEDQLDKIRIQTEEMTKQLSSTFRPNLQQTLDEFNSELNTSVCQIEMKAKEYEKLLTRKPLQTSKSFYTSGLIEPKSPTPKMRFQDLRSTLVSRVQMKLKRDHSRTRVASGSETL